MTGTLAGADGRQTLRSRHHEAAAEATFVMKDYKKHISPAHTSRAVHMQSREDNVTTGPSSPRPLPTLPRWHSCPRHPEAILERGQSGPLKTKTCKRLSFSLRKGRVLPKGTVKSSNYIVSILIGLNSFPLLTSYAALRKTRLFRDHIKECFLLHRLQLYSEWISGNYHTFEMRKKKNTFLGGAGRAGGSTIFPLPAHT